MTALLPTAASLLDALERTGPRPALAWYAPEGRTELSGHVLANWVIKAIGHLDAEITLAPGDPVALAMPPHWKRLVLALAAHALGAEVEVLAPGTAPTREPRVLVTDEPSGPLAEDAEEVLALQPVALAPRFAGELPPLVHDWVAEVRAHPDRLAAPLPAWSGPTPAGSGERVLLTGDGAGAAELPGALAAWLAGGGVVGPAAAVSARAAREEGVSGTD
ncbi:TIGR03089 family protein [Brachybacterium squillarum]|uniref:TIGR03089 family protein n=1 Tax=Brachybacterium squillarum TaxID=661979 RepID=UPI0002629BAC|nr:TIGR03089 family protein [Brachybacterium squillarum]